MNQHNAFWKHSGRAVERMTLEVEGLLPSGDRDSPATGLGILVRIPGSVHRAL